MIQYSSALVMESKSCGVLDTPLSRSMTPTRSAVRQYALPQLAASSRSSVSSRIAASASIGSPNAKPWAYSHPN